MKKIILISLGSLFLLLAIIGLLLPVFPTTPFLLLATACYMRSSETLYNKIISHKQFGPLVKNYLNDRSITRKTKIVAVSSLWVFMSFSAYFFVTYLWAQVMMFLTALGVSLYLLSLKTTALNSDASIATSQDLSE